MIQKIDLFMPTKGQYGVLHHFTTQLAASLNKVGVDTRILEAEYNNPRPFLEQIFSGKPDCTLSFNGLLPDEEGRFFCEMIKTPHIACLLDSPIEFYSLAQSSLNVVGCVDREDVKFYEGIQFSNAFFFPHAADASIEPASSRERIYEVTILASLIDYIAIRNSWRERFPPLVVQAMEDAAELVLTTPSTTCSEAFAAVIDTYMRGPVLFDPSTVDFLSCLLEIELYVKGKDRVEMIRSIDSAKVYLFGSSQKGASWQKYVSDRPNVVVHDAIPFDQAIEILKQSKLTLCNAAWIKSGARARPFYSLASGALPIIEENNYLSEFYKGGESIGFFQAGQWDTINETVDYYLANESERADVAAAGRDITMEHHTWDVRAQQLVEQLTPILERTGVNNEA